MDDDWILAIRPSGKVYEAGGGINLKGEPRAVLSALRHWMHPRLPDIDASLDHLRLPHAHVSW